MPIERYYTKKALVVGETILEGEELNHLNVMRMRPGESLELVDGCGGLATAELTHLSKKTARLQIKSIQYAPLSPPIILAQAMPQKAHLEWILEKGTELGVTEFWLFPGMLSEKKELKSAQEERMQKILISAMKQCGRLDRPTIHIKPALAEWSSCKERILYGSIDPKAPPLLSLKPSSPCIFCVGPEKGFHKEELLHLKRLGSEAVSLNRNILRVETAAITAAALLSQWSQQTSSS